MAVTYEWDVEELEEAPAPENEFDPDIMDHHFFESYKWAKGTLQLLELFGSFGRIVLVRNVGNDVEGLTDRAWAYVENGKLPETFTYGADEDSGIPVPKKFHKEVDSLN